MSRQHRTNRWITVNIAAMCILLVSARSYQDQSRLDKQRDKIRSDALKSNPIPKNGSRLLFQYSFPNENLIDSDIFFGQAVDLCTDSMKRIYVSDASRSAIFIFDKHGKYINKIGTRGQGPGELNYPIQVFCDNHDNMYVDDSGNGRVNLYDNLGLFMRSFRFYRPYFSFIADYEREYIYAHSPSGNYGEKSLIDILTKDGKHVGSFGERPRFKNETTTHNSVLLFLDSDNNIYAAWKYFNIIRKYSPGHELLREFSVNNKAIKAVATYNDNNMITRSDGGTPVKNIYDGLYVYDNVIYLLKIFPRIEIFACNDRGDVDRVYWYEYESTSLWKNLIVDKTDRDIKFYLLQTYPENRVDVFTEMK